jgi:uncharacterized SAM-binding protein YcdF (DUF218 family)
MLASRSTDMYRFIEQLLRPYTLLLIVMGLGLAALWWRRKESRRKLCLVTVPFLLLLAVSTPFLSYYVMGLLEWRYPPLHERPAETQAIVVLLSGYHPPSDERPEAELAADSMYRCVHAAKLYHGGGRCTIVLTGGKSNPAISGPSGAEVMRDFLARLGVDPSDMIVDPNGVTTYRNAVGSREILEERNIHQIVLVTEAVHMPRAALCFEKQGFAVTAAPCHLRAVSDYGAPFPFLPQSEAASDTALAAHEGLGLLWYLLKGRI